MICCGGVTRLHRLHEFVQRRAVLARVRELLPHVPRPEIELLFDGCRAVAPRRDRAPAAVPSTSSDHDGTRRPAARAGAPAKQATRWERPASQFNTWRSVSDA